MFLSFRMVVFQFDSNWTKTRLANGERKSANNSKNKVNAAIFNTRTLTFSSAPEASLYLLSMLKHCIS